MQKLRVLCRSVLTLSILGVVLGMPHPLWAESLKLAWTDISSGDGQEEGVRIERKCVPEANFSALVTLPTPDLEEYIDTTAPTDVLCTYRLLAYNAIGDSPWSTEISGRITAEGGLEVIWTDLGTDEIGFRIERKCVPEGSFSALVTLATPDLQQYADKTAPVDVLCTFRVLSYNAGGDSAWSNESSGTAVFAGAMTDPPPPPPPPPSLPLPRPPLHPLHPLRPIIWVPGK